MSVSLITQSDDVAVIDTHAHIFPDKIAEKAKESVGSFYNLPMHTVGTLDELYKVRSECNPHHKIVAQTIFSPAMSASQTKSINDFIAGLCAGDKSLIGFGTLHRDNTDFASEIKRIQCLGLKGVKFHSDFQQTNIDDERMFPIYGELEKNYIPVIFHMGDKKLDYSSPRRLKNVLEKFPNLIVIAAHMGGYSHWKEAYDILPKSERLFFDTSSTFSFISDYEFRALADKFGTDKIFFGSDFPIFDPNDEIEKLHKTGLKSSDIRRIEYYNYVEFLNKYC